MLRFIQHALLITAVLSAFATFFVHFPLAPRSASPTSLASCESVEGIFNNESSAMTTAVMRSVHKVSQQRHSIGWQTGTCRHKLHTLPVLHHVLSELFQCVLRSLNMQTHPVGAPGLTSILGRSCGTHARRQCPSVLSPNAHKIHYVCFMRTALFPTAGGEGPAYDGGGRRADMPHCRHRRPQVCRDAAEGFYCHLLQFVSSCCRHHGLALAAASARLPPGQLPGSCGNWLPASRSIQ